MSDSSAPGPVDGAPADEGRAAFWVGLDLIARLAVQIVALVLLGRLLSPEDFGRAALALAPYGLANLLVEQFFADSLVQVREATARLASAAFYCALALAVAGGLLVALVAAPLLDRLVMPETAALTAALALVLPLSAYIGVATGWLQRHFRFRFLAKATLAARSSGAILAVSLAVAGFGPWSLLAQVAGTALVLALLLFALGGWRPGAARPFGKLRSLLDYALGNMAVELASLAVAQIATLVIGSLYGAAALGYFNLASRAVETLASAIDWAFHRFALAFLSPLQQRREELIETLGRACRVLAAGAFPLFIVLGLAAEPLLTLAFGPAWRPAEPIFQGLAAATLVYFCAIPAQTAIYSLGRPVALLPVQAVDVAALILLLRLFEGLGLAGVGLARLGAQLASTLTTLYAVARASGLGMAALLQPLWPATLAGAVLALGLVALNAGFADWPVVARLLLPPLLAAPFYLLLIVVLDPTIRAMLTSLLRR